MYNVRLIISTHRFQEIFHPQPKFNMLMADSKNYSGASISCMFGAISSKTDSNKKVVLPSDSDVSDALSYLFRTASLEVKEFVKPEILNPISTGGGHIVPPLSEIPIFAYFQIGNIGCYHLTFSFYQLSDKWKRN